MWYLCRQPHFRISGTKCLRNGTFLGLDNLRELYIPANSITCVDPGGFGGLRKIESITLNMNRIEEINAGVFGELCKDDFEVSCKNVTSSEYCNGTNALTTLKYLNLASNNINRIHRFAFVSCETLETLVLYGNWLLSLDETFLYTPGLKSLHLMACGIGNIPNNAFECTPMLSELHIGDNDKINKLPVDALRFLRNLRTIEDRCEEK